MGARDYPLIDSLDIFARVHAHIPVARDLYNGDERYDLGGTRHSPDESIIPRAICLIELPH